MTRRQARKKIRKNEKILHNLTHEGVMTTEQEKRADQLELENIELRKIITAPKKKKSSNSEQKGFFQIDSKTGLIIKTE